MIVAKKFAAPGRRKVHFAVSDAVDFSAELNDLGLSYVNDSPVITPVVVARDPSERRYVMQQPLTYVNSACSVVCSHTVVKSSYLSFNFFLLVLTVIDVDELNT